MSRALSVRRRVRLAEARPNDGRCGRVAEALESEFGWRRRCGFLLLLDASVSWVHCWNVTDDGAIVDATADQFGSLWLGDVVTVGDDEPKAGHYLAEPEHWDLRLAGSGSAPETLLCAQHGEERTLVADTDRPWVSLASGALRLVTGWDVAAPVVDIAARALRARLHSHGAASTADLIRPLVTHSIQHLALHAPELWVASEFRDQL